MQRIVIVTSLFLYINSIAFAQQWTTYTAANSGLVDNTVRAVCIDSYGVKWFGTSAGLCRFDGGNWITFTAEDSLAHNSVNDIAYEMDWGTEIWVATDGGVSVVDIRPDAITFATPYRTDKTGLISNYVNSVTVDNNHMKWFGTDEGISRFDGSNWVNFTSQTSPYIYSDIILSSAASDSGRLFFGTDGGGVTCIDAETAASPYNTESHEILSDVVLATYVSPDNTEWFGTTQGLSTHKGELSDSGWINYKTADGLADNVVLSIARGTNGVFWIGTEQGLSRFDGTNWTVFTTSDGLAGNIVYDIAVDGEGSLWIGTNNGVTRFFPEQAAVVESANLPNELAIRGTFPNPFNSSASIAFHVPKKGIVSLDIYNLNGQRIRRLMNGNVSEGTHTVIWNGLDDAGIPSASGMYITLLRMGTVTTSYRMVLIK